MAVPVPPVMMGVYYTESGYFGCNLRRIDGLLRTGYAHAVAVWADRVPVGAAWTRRWPCDSACSSSWAAVHLACQSLRLRIRTWPWQAGSVS